ncbi:hypothetical protein CHGG_01490 [Chaetomium globosum CBS 148.51]|uniref:Wax synthase domain-containing protein n=1 Tax=Chaetomium globosum (strain ATCC 6205 / CBS 148.51 / DSM 1962 / NBRC 6347 / NRRL 1970) TaxID=306901 RepID=Q2HE64_CHAGB|nr:uncharacterized protein CHGG_01490 [Chaetomium globosum CBS 148.51]EAQ93255.1 hypothetical protein CHGG_01490 [Chaetomium globosum CBS 148.51]
MVPPDESVAASLPHNEYFWQPFPATASYLTRLGWTADLLTACRGAGWNFSISSIPHPPFPTKPLDGNELVRLDLIPLASRTGTRRSQTYAAFLRSRLLEFALSYLTIDILTGTMRHDPYFVLGPDYAAQGHPLPALYARLPLPAVTIPVLRNIPALAGIMAGMHLEHSLLQLAIVFPLRGLFGARAELWQHPTLFGGFVPSVLDRGLAGFWGGWWHQTFRAGFVAPTRWWFASRRPSHPRGNPPADNGPDNKPSAAPPPLLEAFFAFLLSGILHSGRRTHLPSRAPRAPWTSNRLLHSGKRRATASPTSSTPSPSSNSPPGAWSTTWGGRVCGCLSRCRFRWCARWGWSARRGMGPAGGGMGWRMG